MATSRRLGVLGGIGLLASAVLLTRAALRHARKWELRGRTVVITGASRGLGYATARAFAKEGCNLAICARDPQELAGLREELRSLGAPDVLVSRCDVTQPDEVRSFIHETIAKFEEIDVLVNNAAELQVGPVVAMHPTDFDEAFRNIFWTMYHPTMAVLPYMRTRGAGRIVNVTSIAGKIPHPHMATYTAAKCAATGFSEVLTVELAKDGLQVSTITPPPLRNAAYLNTWFKGRAEQEFAWFTKALTSKSMAIDVERAARAVVEAARYGDPERAVSPSAWALARLHAIAPGLSTALLALADQKLLPAVPPPGDDSPPRLGVEIQSRSENPAVLEAADAGREEALEYRQPLTSL